MTKLCPRGKAAAKRKFKVYPSAYANAYASKICAGKIKDPSGVKRKDFRGSKAEGGLMEATARLKKQGLKGGGISQRGISRGRPKTREEKKQFIKKKKEDSSVTLGKYMKATVDALNESVKAGGMKKERITEGSNMRSPRRFIEDVEAGKYSKPSKDAAYYKSIGLTGERGDKAVKDFFKPEKLKSKNMATGGRAMYKSGMRVCKLAKKGKGRAYGKNS